MTDRLVTSISCCGGGLVVEKLDTSVERPAGTVYELLPSVK